MWIFLKVFVSFVFYSACLSLPVCLFYVVAAIWQNKVNIKIFIFHYLLLCSCSSSSTSNIVVVVAFAEAVEYLYGAKVTHEKHPMRLWLCGFCLYVMLLAVHTVVMVSYHRDAVWCKATASTTAARTVVTDWTFYIAEAIAKSTTVCHWRTRKQDDSR